AVPRRRVRPFVLVVVVLAPAEGGEHRGDRLVQLGRRLGRGGGSIRRGGGSLRRPVVVGPAAVGPVVIGPVVLGLVLHQVQQPVRLRLLLRRGGAARSAHPAGVDEGEAARHAAEPAVGPAVTDRDHLAALAPLLDLDREVARGPRDRKSTRLNSSHVSRSYAVYCLQKKRTPTSHR